MNKVKRVFHNDLFLSILLIILISAIAYLPLINQLGFYGDDWANAWGAATFGSQKIARDYAGERPFMGLVFSYLYHLTGSQPLNWHLMAFFLRISGALIFLWLVRLVWPEHKFATLCMAFIYAVYPGYLVMPEAYNTMLLGVDLGLLSITLTIWAMLDDRKAVRIISLILSGLLALGCVLMFEWFIGVEGLRAALIFTILHRRPKTKWAQRISQLLLYWAPAIIGMFIFLFWRVFIFRSLRVATDINFVALNYLKQPLHETSRVIFGLIRSFWQSVCMAWFVPLYNLWWSEAPRPLVLAILYGILAIAGFVLTSWHLFGKNNNTIHQLDSQGVNNEIWTKEGMLVGFIGVLATLLPVVITGRQVILLHLYNRFTLNAISALSIFIVAALFWLAKHPLSRIVLIAFLIGMAVVIHNLNSEKYQNLTQFQRDFWWQLSWRAPDIQNGTVIVPLLSKDYRFGYFGEIFAGANFIYRPKVQDYQIGAQTLTPESTRNMLREIELNNPPQLNNSRSYPFMLDYQKLLVMSKEQDSCLHVWDGNQLELDLSEDALISVIAPFSKIDQIDVSAQPHTPPQELFGAEPPHTWCYYYQKASLARQKGDWDTLVALAQQAEELGYHTHQMSEWMPIFEGYANLQQYQKAGEIVDKLKTDLLTVKMLCRRFSVNQSIPNHFSSYAFQYAIRTLCSDEN